MTKAISSAELIAKLQADPKHQEAEIHRAARQSAVEYRLRAEETPLINELKDAGWYVESVWDLVNTTKPYAEIIPILLLHLKKPYSDRLREGIARALAVPEAIDVWQTLRTAYESSHADSDVKRGLAAALAAASDDNVIAELAEIAKNPKNGSSRLLLLRALRRSRSAIAIGALRILSIDPELSKEISSWKN